MTLQKKILTTCCILLVSTSIFAKQKKITIAKKLDEKNAFIVFGMTLDKSLNIHGLIKNTGRKSYPSFISGFTNCSEEIMKIRTSKNSKFDRKNIFECNYKERKNTHRLNQKYYVYKIPPDENLSWEGFYFAFSGLGEYKKVGFDDAIKNLKFKKRLTYKTQLKNALKSGVRRSRISPGVLHFKQKFEAGKAYYLGNVHIELHQKSHPEYGDQEYFEKYVQYVVPKKYNFSFQEKEAQAWFKKTFKSDKRLNSLKDKGTRYQKMRPDSHVTTIIQ